MGNAPIVNKAILVNVSVMSIDNIVSSLSMCAKTLNDIYFETKRVKIKNLSLTSEKLDLAC